MKARNVEIPARLENAAGSIVIPIDPGIFASEIERLTLQNTRVMLLRDQGEDEDQLLLEVDLDLKRDGSLRELQLSARGGGDLTINAAGSGVGDPFDLRGFKGNIEGQITATDIAAMAGFFDLRFLDVGIFFFGLMRPMGCLHRLSKLTVRYPSRPMETHRTRLLYPSWVSPNHKAVGLGSI